MIVCPCKHTHRICNQVVKMAGDPAVDQDQHFVKQKGQVSKDYQHVIRNKTTQKPVPLNQFPE